MFRKCNFFQSGGLTSYLANGFFMLIVAISMVLPHPQNKDPIHNKPANDTTILVALFLNTFSHPV